MPDGTSIPTDVAVDAAGVSGADGSSAPADSDPLEKQPSPFREEAGIVADDLIKTRIYEVIEKYRDPDGNIDPGKMSAAEINLFAIAQYEAGFTDEEYAGAGEDGKVLRGGLEVTTTDGEKVTITSLLSEEDTDGGKTYKARAKIDDPDNPGTTKQTEVHVDADEVVRSHMEARSDSIADNFTDSSENTLVKWRTSGRPDNPPEIAKEVTEKDIDDPIKVADEIINNFHTDIQLEINNLKNKDKLTPDEQAELAQKEQALGKLKLLTQINGTGFAELARFGALQILINAGSEVEGLDTLQDVLQPGAEKGLKTLQEKLIKESGATESDLALLEEYGFGALMNNPDLLEKVIKIQGIDQMVFGREVSDEEIIGMIGGTLTEDQKKWLEGMKKTGKGAGILLAILLAIPAAVAAGAVYVGAQGAMSGQRR